MATALEFACPRCSAACACHSRPGEIVRCPHCYSFITVPEDDLPQFKVAADRPEPDVSMIVFRCPYCQSRIETDPANAGLACLCPGCHAGLTIPGNARPIFLRSNGDSDRHNSGQHVQRVPTAVTLMLWAAAVALIAVLASLIR